ncbi:MAG: putative polysaccharide-degrading enzyme [Verrucomicrobiales bacterium]|nr:putative polysaccharide-degrading enzyme [Verrucomicrobiales bacterium]
MPTRATTYEVGPGKPYTSIGAVPWENLQAGDTVLINWRPTSYNEKWVICRQGTNGAPITVRGVPNESGQLPVIDGNGATTRSALNYWNESRGVIKIGGASRPRDTTPTYITIENLEVRSVRPPFTFTGYIGTTQAYLPTAAAIYIEKGENITLRNCILRDSAHGLFISSTDTQATKNVLIEKCYFYDNGMENDIYRHNVYTEAAGITYQFNRFGRLRTGCPGNNLKDRSAGLVVRYNWIEGGNRELDLVDAVDSYLVRGDPRYPQTFVYGNVLIEPTGDGNKQMVHYGGDSGQTSFYRKGALYFYNNTVISRRTDGTTLFRFSTTSESGDMRNNIIYAPSAAANTLVLLESSLGVLYSQRNWITSLKNDGTSSGGTFPGFIDETNEDFRLAPNSLCINAGTNLSADEALANELSFQYGKHQAQEPRVIEGC